MATFGVAQKTPYPSYGVPKQKQMNYGLSPVASHVAQYRDPLATSSVPGTAGGTLGSPGSGSTGRFNSFGTGAPIVPQVDFSKQAQQQASAPVTIPDYTADPALQQITALAQNNAGDARARAMAQRKQLAVDFGDENWARQVTGEDLTAQAARDNPFGVTQQLAKQRTSRTSDLEDSLNKANLFYGGYRGKALSDLENSFVQAQSEAQGRAQNQFGSIEEALLAAEQNSQTQQLNAQQDAYWNAITAGAINQQPYGAGGAGGATVPSVPDPTQSVYSQYVQPNLPAAPTNPVLSDEERRRLAALSAGGATFV